MAQPPQDLNQLVAELNKGMEAPAAEGPWLERAREDHEPSPELDSLLRLARNRDASDLLLVAGIPVGLRIGGRLERQGNPVLEGDGIRRLLLPLLSQGQVRELERNRSADFCFSWQGSGRFRANVHYQRGTLAGCIRLLPLGIPTLKSLNLPASLRRFTELRQGLVLLTGATGSGKSSTLAALLDIINGERQDHVVTIEDPVEFVHASRNCMIEHIEVGQDAPDFATSLRSILRQSPDVILVGEMRDPETIQTALTAAETGHLVFSSLHTNDCSQAVSRILDAFPLGNQGQIRQQLSLALAGIVAQQLVPSRTGALFPVLEILTASNAVRSTVRKGDDHQIYTLLSTGKAEGMNTMEQGLAEMVRSGRITEDVAMAHSFRPLETRRYL
jgi:twitching motility protein PilT